jgi:pyroglutamyl-peptidase
LLVRVLVTGFQPFLDEKVNPTQAIVEFVNSCEFHKVDSKLSRLDVRGLVLPVEFDQAFHRLEQERISFRPEVIVSFGLAGGRQTFDIEMLAVNERGGEQSDRGDNQGKVFSGPIDPTSPRVLSTTLPVDVIRGFLSAANVPNRKSFSAGTYVCNDLFFKTQERLRFTRVRSGFVHVPRIKSPGSVSDGLEWPIFEAAVIAILKSF